MSTEISAEGEVRMTLQHRRVVVGFDASAGAYDVVEWAAREADARMSSLRVVTCWAVPLTVDFYGVGARQAEALAEVVATAQRVHPGLSVESAATHLDPRDALIDEASRADLLVIGSSEPGAARTLLLGSVARTAARRSPCPVVVVRGRGVRDVRRIVVGIDGSSASMSALDWACDEANRHGGSLSLVHSWEHLGSRDAANQVLDDALTECRARTSCPVSGELCEGSPSTVLVRASRNADVVAIGSRGRSGFKTALFGSVALEVAEHSECPVAITHPRMRR
ncbi:MAG: universal stress protein [Actinobacteria bacterium]|nr:universal stress protein [Actinomycetota bacterium]